MGDGRSELGAVAIPIRSILISDSSFRVESAIDSFIRYLAVERGLSDNYQLSTQRSLNDFASCQWPLGPPCKQNRPAATLKR